MKILQKNEVKNNEFGINPNQIEVEVKDLELEELKMQINKGETSQPVTIEDI